MKSLPPDQPETVTSLRALARKDLYWLATAVMGRTDLDTEWHYQRAKEIEAEPFGGPWLWPRGSGKTFLITIAGTLQITLQCHGQGASWDHEATVLILSSTKSAAKSFVRVLQMEMQQNNFLRSLFPVFFYVDPVKEPPVFSLDLGLTVKRKVVRPEASVECAGLNEGAPVGGHHSVVCGDDLVVLDGCRSESEMKKTIEPWQIAQNLLSRDGKVGVVICAFVSVKAE